MAERKQMMLSLIAIGGLIWACAPSLAGLSTEREQELERLVRQDCGSCHGMTFKGGLGSPLTSSALAERSDETLKEVISNGIPGTPMPPWRDLLSEPDIDWIISYLRDGGLNDG